MPESLLDMHLKTLKKKKKVKGIRTSKTTYFFYSEQDNQFFFVFQKLEKEAKELGLSTRRPFDRDVDLQANRLDNARKKKIFEKAGRLNDRFSTAKML